MPTVSTMVGKLLYTLGFTISDARNKEQHVGAHKALSLSQVRTNVSHAAARTVAPGGGDFNETFGIVWLSLQSSLIETADGGNQAG